MERQKDISNVNFNFTPEQQERFNIIYEESKKVHPELVIDEASKTRVKTLIAYTVINDNIPLKQIQKIEEENL